MSTNSSLHVRSLDRSPERIHTWLRALEGFGIPFLCYDSSGQRTHVSPAAAEIIEVECVGSTLGARADEAAGIELQQSGYALRIGEFPLVRELPTWLPGLVLAVHLPSGGTGAVVVIRPARDACSRSGAFPELSARESVVARLIAAGLPTKQIAIRLDVSEHTARHHTERVFAKLGVHNRAGAAAVISARLRTPVV